MVGSETSGLTQAQLGSYQETGFVLSKNLLPADTFDTLEARCLAVMEEFSGQRFASLDDPELVRHLAANRESERHLYDAIRDYDELAALSSRPELATIARQLLGEDDIVLLEKIPFRIDLPLVSRELAVWHQDHFYVRGTTETITAWIPLYDVAFHDGCLLIMPGTHAQGPVPHDIPALGKKYYPSSIFENEVKYVQMKRGDVLFFHSCLLHSSGNNIGDSIRYSIQSRYTPARCESDAGMGERISLS